MGSKFEKKLLYSCEEILIYATYNDVYDHNDKN